MKTISFVFAALTALVLTGCVKDAPVLKPTDEPTKFTELTVNENFSWKMIADVKCAFTAPHEAKVGLFMAANDADPFMTFGVAASMKPVELSVPCLINTLYVKYETAPGVWSAASALSVTETMNYAVPANSYDYSATRAANTPVQGQIIYPNPTSWGTLLFEDLWPGYGDYDFNDLVAQYRIEENYQKTADGRTMVSELLIKLNIKAVGGSLPNQLGLTLNSGVISSEISKIVINSDNKVSTTVNITYNNKPADAYKDAIIWIDGLYANTHKPKGATYVNTERGFEMEANDLVQVNFSIFFATPIDQRFLTLDKLNFFIHRTDKENRQHEIHLAGQKPTYLGVNDYYAIQRSSINTDRANKLYYSNTNLVWAINIPAAISHAYEDKALKGQNFMEAYPDFKTWAQSNGILKQDWYLHGVDEKLVRIRK